MAFNSIFAMVLVFVLKVVMILPIFLINNYKKPV
jgi:hypothetical protein